MKTRHFTREAALIFTAAGLAAAVSLIALAIIALAAVLIAREQTHRAELPYKAEIILVGAEAYIRKRHAE